MVLSTDIGEKTSQHNRQNHEQASQNNRQTRKKTSQSTDKTMKTSHNHGQNHETNKPKQYTKT
jgi:hypothetical protein